MMFITRKRFEELIEDARDEAEDKAWNTFSERKYKDRIDDKLDELEEKVAVLTVRIEELERGAR